MRIAVLGDMLELGFSEIQEHVNISKFARLDKIDKVYCVGSRMKNFSMCYHTLSEDFGLRPQKKCSMF